MNQDFLKNGPFSQIADKINEIERKLREILSQSVATVKGARVYRASDQIIPDSTETPMSFDTTRWDTDTCFSAGTPTRLTATTAGKYSIVGHILFASNATGVRRVSILLNGVTTIASDRRSAASAGGTHFSVPTTWDMAAGDYVELYVFHTRGANLNVAYLDAYSTEFSIMRIGI